MDRTEEWKRRKDRGNTLFTECRYVEAIQEYSAAIVLAPREVVLFTNRALCHSRLCNFTMVEDDCRKAIDLDMKSCKAHYLLGKAQLELRRFDEAIKSYTRALSYSKEQERTKEFHDDAFDGLYMSKRHKWMEKNAELVTKLENLKERCKQLLRDNPANPNDTPTTDDELSLIEAVFMERSEVITDTVVPESMCCGISMELMRDPVVTPSGNTFDRKMLISHIRENGPIDPVSRQHMTADMLIPNLAMKSLIQEHFDRHPWAYPNPK